MTETKNRILLIDNYDSFTYNLVQAFQAEEAQVVVYRNDKIGVADALKEKPSHLVISPGPGNPENAGNSIKLIEAFYEKIPILGVCLGHQCLVQYFGGNIIRAKQLMHGKASKINHDEKTIFRNLPNPFIAGRYHSLSVEALSVPDLLEVTATTDNQEIMGIRHRNLPIEGVQFHPESILTPDGSIIIRNFLGIDNNE
ncbi:MAG: anthranilate synthase/aminodeoxychorismate synthase-like glutamine amidotransferase [Woeseiaceae bacterium]|jgi:anthranilate synthase/aminodeoxychorismate synthase-like glutamine amidotransferase|tara:strand:- start:8584 stop:9177 length:594 start_codon:yes stop_codon:yes gene_type:complete